MKISDPFDRNMVLALAVMVGALAAFIVFAIVFDDPSGTNTPVGCVWIDMDSGKSNNMQLACVEGYGWSNE